MMPIRAAESIMTGSLIFLIYMSTSMLAMAINKVGISFILRDAITKTDPIRAPTTAALIPSTNAFIEEFFAIFLKYGAGITVKR